MMRKPQSHHGGVQAIPPLLIFYRQPECFLHTHENKVMINRVIMVKYGLSPLNMRSTSKMGEWNNLANTRFTSLANN